jgi:diguanylate cyclase (GGDEF)-like protein
MSLKLKIVLFVLCAIGGTVLAILGAVVFVTVQHAPQESEANLAHAHAGFTALINDREAQLVADAHLMVKNEELVRALQSRDVKSLQELFVQMRSITPQVDLLGATAPNGDYLSGVGPPNLLQSDKAQAPTIIRALVAAGTSQKVVLLGQHPYVFVSIPVPNAGWLVLLSDMGSEALSRFAARQGADILLLSEGKVIAASLAYPGETAPDVDGLTSVDINGVDYAADATDLEDSHGKTGLVTIALHKSPDLERVAKQLFVGIGIILLIALPVAFFAATRFSEDLLRPLESLREAANNLRSGKWPVTDGSERNDEIGELNAVFAEMSYSVKDAQEKLTVLATSDPTTELLNRRAFDDQLTDIFENQLEEPGGFLVVDLDRFAEFNRKLGLREGERALVRVAKRLKHSLEAGLPASRWSNEHLAVFVPGTEEDAQDVAVRIRQAVEDEYRKDEFRLTASVGYAMFPEDGSDLATLGLAAELAATTAQQKGRNTVARAEQRIEHPEVLARFLNVGDLASIYALIDQVDGTSSFTDGHSRRVAQHAMELARFLGIDDRFVELLQRACLLHDIGRLGIPEELLNNPNPLTDEDREIIERIPELGERVVRRIPHLSDVIPGIRNSHERWDGEGYPDSLTGEQIPYVARFVAIADSFDAMTCERPHRKGLPLDMALKLVGAGAGTQFDPNLARAFVRMKKEQNTQEQIRPRHAS